MKKIKKLEPNISRLEVPYSVQQDKLEVEIKNWIGNYETRHSLIFRTSNSYISISLSRKQMILLKERMLEFN